MCVCVHPGSTNCHKRYRTTGQAIIRQKMVPSSSAQPANASPASQAMNWEAPSSTAKLASQPSQPSHELVEPREINIEPQVDKDKSR